MCKCSRNQLLFQTRVKALLSSSMTIWFTKQLRPLLPQNSLSCLFPLSTFPLLAFVFPSALFFHPLIIRQLVLQTLLNFCNLFKWFVRLLIIHGARRGDIPQSLGVRHGFNKRQGLELIEHNNHTTKEHRDVKTLRQSNRSW